MSFRALSRGLAMATLLAFSAFAAHVDGKWVGKTDGQTHTFELKADGSTLTGTANGVAIENGKIDGDVVTFVVGKAQYSGQVSSDQLDVTLTDEGKSPVKIIAKRASGTT